MSYRYFISLFVIILLIVSLLIKHYLEQSQYDEVFTINQQSVQIDKTVYQTIFNTHKITAQNHFVSLLENQKVMKLLKSFKDETNVENKNLLRGELFRLLNKKYQVLKELGIRQFHFHTHDSKSLLRFHKPEKNGDSLLGIRKSVEHVNTSLEPFFGFEGGKIFPGFRYVFPLIFENEHLGSVEFSIPFEVIEKEIQMVLPKYGYQLHLDKSVSYDKVFENLKMFFVPSLILKNYYTENSIISLVEKKLEDNKIINTIQLKVKSILESQNNDVYKDDFSIYFIEKNKGYKVDFISIKDYDNIHIAYMLCYDEFERLISIEKKYFYFHFLLYITTIVILILIYLIFSQIQKLEHKNRNIQQILDTQDNIVILSNGEELNFANIKFFNFLGFKTLEEFKKYHKCICEFFVENDRFFHLGKIKEDENWIEIMLSLSDSQQIVAMLGKDFILHAYSVSINKFDKELMIVTFTDITQTMHEYIELEEKTIHDKLTNAFNREYFEKNYQIILNQCEMENKNLAIALLDIDHFKLVNDKYGHDIGDEILIQFVKTIEKYSRKDDVLVRWGGEEFILILKVQTEENLLKVLENLRQVIQLRKFNSVGQITCSIGGTIYKNGENIEQTIKRADEALYKAKINGRNKVINNI